VLIVRDRRRCRIEGCTFSVGGAVAFRLAWHIAGQLLDSVAEFAAIQKPDQLDDVATRPALAAIAFRDALASKAGKR
jgi:hypothetical protein